MLTKKECIEMILKDGNYNSIKEAEHCYNTVMNVLEKGLLKKGSIKIPKVGIIRQVDKKGKKVKVPGIEEKIQTPDRKGLSFTENDDIKKALN